MMRNDEEDGEERKPHKANLDDEFLQHPDSGAFIRNPLRNKPGSDPIRFSSTEFAHNCLDDAFHNQGGGEWHTITVTEAGLKEMTAEHLRGQSPSAAKAVRHRAALHKLRDLPEGYDFAVTLKKSHHQPPRNERRRPMGGKEAAHTNSVTIEKVNIEVSDADGAGLRVENVMDGLVGTWNKTHPNFAVKVGDHIVRVNEKKSEPAAMLEEFASAPDVLRLTVHRAQRCQDLTNRRGSELEAA